MSDADITSGAETQKQIVKYSLLKEMDPAERGEEHLSLSAKEIYEYKQAEIQEAKLKAAQAGSTSEFLYWMEEWNRRAYNFNYWVKMNKVRPSEMAQYKVRYLTSEAEREEFELKGGNPIKQGKPPNERVYDTSGSYSVFSGEGWAIYVMDSGGKIYAHRHMVSRFHHSSFLAGGDVAGAGEIKVERGELKGISNKSGHYRPGPEHLVQVLQELRSRGVKLEGVAATVYGLDPNNPGIPQDYPGGAAQFLEDQEHRLGQGAGAGAGGGGAPSVVR
jgi:hypothetical protein